RRQPGMLLGALTHAASVLLTYLAVLTGMIFFRSSSVGMGAHMLAGMVGLHGFGGGVASGTRGPACVLCLFAVFWTMPNTQQLLARYEPALGQVRPYNRRLQWQGSLGWGLLLGAGFAAAVLAMGGTSEFIYFQF